MEDTLDTLSLAGKLYQSIEANQKALQATISQQHEEIRSLKQHIAALEAAALARSEEQVANNNHVEQLERQTAAMALQLSAQGDEITRVKRYNAKFIAQYSAWNEWIEEQHAALAKIQSLLPSGNNAMVFMEDVRNKLGIKDSSARGGTPPYGQSSSPEAILNDPLQDTMSTYTPEQDASEDQNTITCAVFVPMDLEDAPTPGTVPEAMPGLSPGAVPEIMPDMLEALPEIQPQIQALVWPDVPDEMSDMPEVQEILQTLPQLQSETIPRTQAETLLEPANEPFGDSLVVADNSQPNTNGESATQPTNNTPTHLRLSTEEPQNSSQPVGNQLSAPAPRAIGPSPLAGVFATQTPNRSTEKPVSAKRRMLQRPSATGSDSEDDLTKGNDTFVNTPQRGGQHGGRAGQRGARRKSGKTGK